MAKVIVYKNLRRGDWSVAAVKGNIGRGKVIDHVSEIVLADVTLIVSEASRQTVIKKKERSVHAYAIGTLVSDAYAPFKGGVPITYNPYRCGSFTRRDTNEPIDSAAFIHFTADRGAVAYL